MRGERPPWMAGRRAVGAWRAGCPTSGDLCSDHTNDACAATDSPGANRNERSEPVGRGPRMARVTPAMDGGPDSGGGLEGEPDRRRSPVDFDSGERRTGCAAGRHSGAWRAGSPTSGARHQTLETLTPTVATLHILLRRPSGTGSVSWRPIHPERIRKRDKGPANQPTALPCKMLGPIPPFPDSIHA